MRIKVGLRVPPPATIHATGGRGNTVIAWATAAAVMITDTAPFRYPHYHRSSDTPDKVDAEKVARVVKGMERVVRELSR